jgi:hypothetical protein
VRSPEPSPALALLQDRRAEYARASRSHGKDFKALGVELGLAGRMTTTVASPELLDFINWTLLPKLGQ